MDIAFPAGLTIQDVLSDLARIGATSFPILDSTLQRYLREEALAHTYELQPKVVFPWNVQKEVAVCETFPPESLFPQLQCATQKLFDDALRVLPPDDYPFTTPLNFNHLVLQRYEPGSEGISPHRDARRYVNLMAIFVLTGRARFCLCADRQGNDPRPLDASPGKVILLCAPGFSGRKDHLFHFVTDIPDLHVTFGVRQRRA